MSDEDRRHWDPFAPPQAALVGAVQPPKQADDSDEPTGDYEDWKKADLVALAEKEGLATYGSKADLIERLRG